MTAARTFTAGRAGARLQGSLVDALRQFGDQVRTHVVRKATAAAGEVLYHELRARVPVGEGTLHGAAYLWHDDKRSTDSRHLYAVGINKRKAPHWFVVEYGHWRVNVIVRGPGGRLIATKQRLPSPVWVPAVPYLRPTADRMSDALRVGVQRLGALVADITHQGPRS